MGCVSAKESNSYDFQNDSPDGKKKKKREDKKPAWAHNTSDVAAANGYGTIDYGTTDQTWDTSTPTIDEPYSPDKHSHHTIQCDDGKHNDSSWGKDHSSGGHGLWNPSDSGGGGGGGGYDVGGGDTGGGGGDTGGGGCDSGGGGCDSGGGGGSND